VIRIRFVKGRDELSRMIEEREGLAMPFTPSHVECVTPEGKYLGMRFDGGMQAREPGYDARWLEAERVVDLPCTDAQAQAFYAYMTLSIGEPYDWKAIGSFILPQNFHLSNRAICSAKVTLGLRAKGCEWFPMPLAVPAHQISPRDLLLVLSSHVQIDH